MMTTQNFKQRQNWEKAEVVSKCLKDAIVGVVSMSLKKQHETLLSEINSRCSNCRLDTLMPLHMKGNDGCPLQQKNCHCLNAEGKKCCPSSFCSAMYDKILKHHRFRSPNWSTTDITKWYTNYWEVAKCFIPNDKCVDESQIVCIDLLFLCINNVAVLASLDDFMLNKVIGLLKEIKDAQIKFLNSPTKEIEESTMQQYMRDVTNLLFTDWVQNRKEVIDALNKILQSAEKDKEENDQSNDLKENVQNSSKQETLQQRVTNVENNQKKFDEKLGTLNDRCSDLDSSLKQLNRNPKLCENDKNENQSFTGNETEKNIRTVIKESDLETPVISRPLDGRLITLDSTQIDALMRICEPKVLHGGFGDVFISKSKVPELDVQVVIKRISCEEHERIKIVSTLNEKIAARVLHFAIVPLIAYAELELEGAKRENYFLSPYLEQGSLCRLIESDKNCSNIKDVKMRCANRVQILFQIASALDYLHTPVPGYRGIVLHMDVTTMNIVCDGHYNARLIDFGLAREMNEGKQEVSNTQSRSFGTPGYHPTILYSSLTVHEDYHNFGVVIRELLTGKAPFIKCGAEPYELRKLGKNSIKKSLQRWIWQDRSKDVSTLLQLSERCLNSKNENLTSSCIVKELKNILCRNQRMRQEADKCDWCMVNMAVEDGKAPPHGCKMKICVSCMRNSHINPIRCPTCNDEVIPEIGHTFAALLIAGNDLENPALANSFSNDIKEIKDVLASKYPCVIGISDENIKMVTPTISGKKEKLLPQVSAAFDDFHSRRNIKTLLMYFTGHHKTGFVLGCPDDVLQLAHLQEFLEKLSECWEYKARILVFLDCCEPPKMNIGSDLSKVGVKIIQINACRQRECCTQPMSGSLFKTFFVQALTRKIFNKQCYTEKECEECKMSGDFISVERLLEYISNHMKKCVFGKDPVLYADDVSWSDASSIGYNVDFAADLSLKFEEQSQTTIDIKLDQEMYCDINELKKHILQKVNCREDVKLKLTDTFAGVISLRIHTGTKRGKELSTMLQVNAAMNAKREIIASYRSVSHICSGRVAMVVPTDCIYRYFDEKEMLKKTNEERKEANLSFRDFDKVIEDFRERPDLETLHTLLVNVYEAWDKEKDKEDKELRVIFPCTHTENGSEFVVLDLLSKKSKVTVQCLAKPFMKKQWIIISMLAVLVSFIMFIFM